MTAQRGKRRNSHEASRRQPSGWRRLGLVGAAVLVALVVVMFVFSLWKANAGEEALANVPLAEPVTIAEPVMDSSSEPAYMREDLFSDDPVIVAAAIIDLRDDWFYGANNEVIASMEGVFGGDLNSDAAKFVLNGLALQRAAINEAPELNKTFYFSTSLSAKVIQQSDTEAVIEVWDMELISRRELIEPEAKWGIQRLFMERRDGRWIVTLWRDELGPAPAVSSIQRTASATDLELDLDGHAHVPDWLGIVIEGIER